MSAKDYVCKGHGMRWANKDGFQELCFYCRTAKSRIPALAVLPYKEAAKLATEVGETHDLWRKDRDACIERELLKFNTRGGTVDLRDIGKLVSVLSQYLRLEGCRNSFIYGIMKHEDAALTQNMNIVRKRNLG